MRHVSWGLTGALALLALGCSGGTNSPIAPNDNDGVPNPPTASGYAGYNGGAGLGGRTFESDIAQTALAIFTINVDPSTLTATAELKASRSAQKTDDIYELSIENFMTTDTLKITQVGLTATTVDLTYTVTHPFAAPSNLAGPATAANRADLGIGGRVLFLNDVASATGNSYFTGTDDVVAETTLIVNADSYFKPEGLLDLTGFTANTFASKVLVDESADPRTASASGTAISNSGNPNGNYIAASGWQQSNIGANRDSWTGFGTLHQGQTAENVLSVDRDALAVTPFSFDAAIIAKYEDPRGGTNAAQKKANRLPGATADVTKFVYRMPHGAMDVERVTFLSESGGFVTNQASASTLAFQVVDWDARATESAEAVLADDTDPTTVEIGESGAPTLSVCVPGVTGDDGDSIALTEAPDDDDTAVGGDAGEDSGEPGDALYYSESVTKTIITGQTSGIYTGMVRAEDPEASLATRPWNFALKPDLTLASPAPSPVAYASFSIAMNNAPTGTAVRTSSDPLLSGNSAVVDVTGMGDADLDNIDIDVDWGDGAGFVNEVAGLASPYPDQIGIAGPQMNNTDLTADTINLIVRITDGVANLDTPLTYQLGPNRSPVVGGAPALATNPVAPPATFAMNAGTSTATDPEGDAITYKVTANIAPNGPFPSAAGQATFPIPGIGPYPTPGPVVFTVHAQDPLHQNTTPAQPDSTSTWTVNGTIQAPCPNVAYAGTSLGAGGFFSGTYYWAGFGGTQQFPLDSATWPMTNFTAFGGWVTSLDCPGSVSVPNNPYDLVFMQNNSNWVGANPAGATSNFIMTNYGITANQRIHQIEVDRTGRVIFARCNSTYPTTGQRNPTALYNAAQGTESSFKWFDYTGTQVAPAGITTVTTPGRVIALALDDNNDVYVIDHTHMLRKYTKATAYTEVTSAPYPLNLAPIIGSDGGAVAGDANRKVHDFIVNFTNRNFFILVQSRGAAPNARLFRVECTGAFNTPIAGNPNPAIFNLNSDTLQATASDITIDQLNTTGAILATQGEAQIMIGSGIGTVGLNERWIFNTNMQNYVNLNSGLGSTNAGTMSVAINNYLFYQYSGGPQWMLCNHSAVPNQQ